MQSPRDTHLHSTSPLLKAVGLFFEIDESEAWNFPDAFPFTVLSLEVMEKAIAAQKYKMQVLRDMTGRRHSDVANRKV